MSSFEHDGLGRYGDPLDGMADVKTMAWMRDHVVKPGGLLFLSLPMGPDCLVYNAHRIYGPLRWTEAVRGWNVVDNDGFSDAVWTTTKMCDYVQPAFVLQRPQRGEPAAQGMQRHTRAAN
jgi:hypothetical protein